MPRAAIAILIAVALVAMWVWGINRMLAFGFVPPVPGWWPAELGPFNPKMMYYLSILVVWFGLTAIGVRVIMKLTRRGGTTHE